MFDQVPPDLRGCDGRRNPQRHQFVRIADARVHQKGRVPIAPELRMNLSALTLMSASPREQIRWVARPPSNTSCLASHPSQRVKLSRDLTSARNASAALW